MNKLMKPITFGCENGFEEVFYDVNDPNNIDKYETRNVFCYLNLLSDEEKKDKEVIKKCLDTPSKQCWKK